MTPEELTVSAKALSELTPSAALVVISIMLVGIFWHTSGAAIKFGIEWVQHRKGNGVQGTIKANTRALIEVEVVLRQLAELDPPPYPQCHYAPDHFDQIERMDRLVGEIHEMQIIQKDQINQKIFQCRVRGKHLETIERIQWDQEHPGGVKA